MGGSRRTAALIPELEPLLDILVHTQDIVRPLGLNRPMPVELAPAAVGRVEGPVAVGRVEGPVAALLLLVPT